MKSKKITISMSDDVRRLVEKDSELFGGNISAYVTYLILDANKNKSSKPEESEKSPTLSEVDEAIAKKKRITRRV